MKVLKRKRGASIEMGERYGRLVVLARAENGTGGKLRYVCKCDCGKTVEVFATALRSGKCKSCGCLRREMSRKTLKIAAQLARLEASDEGLHDKE